MKRKHIRDERTQRHAPNGDASHGFRTLGLRWRATLEEWFQIELPTDIPPHIVAMMCVDLKAGRACRPFDKPDTDDYDDLHVYADLAEEMDPVIDDMDDVTVDPPVHVDRCDGCGDFIEHDPNADPCICLDCLDVMSGHTPRTTDKDES